MIYIDDHIDDFDLQEALAAVSQQRREYALRYRRERDQRLCVAAYRLLQQALLKEYGIDELPQFIYNQQDKPLLEGHPEIHFSLSHCREAAACAIGDEPVGIDIETMDHYSEEVATRVMNKQEMLQIKASHDPAREFTRLWTMKESLYKLTGDDHGGDIAHMLDDTTQYDFTTISMAGYICTSCKRKHLPGDANQDQDLIINLKIIIVRIEIIRKKIQDLTEIGIQSYSYNPLVVPTKSIMIDGRLV